MIMLIHYPPTLTLPAPWQPNWQGGRALDIPSLPRRLVARAPAGTSIPDGAAPYRPPEVTDEHRRLARADLERIAQGPDPLGAELATSALENQERLDEFIRAWFGVAHSFAWLSPLSEPSLNRAVAAHRHAVGLWHSRHSSVVIRTSYPTGYDVWRGIGSMMQRVGHAETYEAAEQIGVARVRELREQTMARIRDEILDGWSPETPYYSATLSSAATELPITVRRGPMTNEDLGRLPSSYDLPIVAVARGDHVERFPERVTWSDDASRARERQRRAEGHRRAQEEQARALDLLRQSPVVGPHVGPRSLPKGLRFLVGRENVAVTVGPVRLRQDGQVGLALVELHGGHRRPLRTWMALGQLAVRSLDPGPGQGRVDF